MKKIIFGAMAAAALLACSKDQVIEQNRVNDEIAFSIVAENQTKAGAVYCAYNLLPEFNVYATYTQNGTSTAQWYFQNDKIKYVDNAWANQTTTRYWSANGTHDFYAIYNGTMTVTGVAETPAAPQVKNFAPTNNVNEQKDLLYAVATGQTKAANSTSGVALNFRHALSQIEFKAKNTNKQLYVTITDVRVGHTPSQGTFTYPTTSTADSFTDHTQNNTHSYTTGTWELTDNTFADYTASFDAVAVVGQADPVVGLTISTDSDNINTRNFANSMLLLPTSSITSGTTAWTPATDETSFDGTYLAVNCMIYNVAGESYTTSDVCLHEGWAVIPVSFNWEPGKKYIYTFVFGEGNGGYQGGTNNDPTPDDDPVLTPIDYTVTVDDFQKGTDSNVEMKF